MIPTTEDMRRDLTDAGWIQKSATVWVSPGGALYRGPFGAWKALNGILMGSGAPTPEAIIADVFGR